MPSLVDHIRAYKAGRNSGHRHRPGVRVSLRLETLESRCLMSAGNLRIAHHADLTVPVRRPAVATQPIDRHDLDRPSVRQPLARLDQYVEPASSQGDVNPGSGVSGSTNATATVPDLPSGPYVVIRDSNDPHHTRATAQELPDLPFFGVVGTIGTGDPIDLYRLTLGAAGTSLEFALVSDQPATTVPMQLQIFDGSGQVLGEWSVGGQVNASLHAEMAGLPAGSTIYLGITTGNPSGPAGPSATADYQLWISTQPMTGASATATSAGTSAATSAIMPLFASPPPAASTGRAVLPSSGDSQATFGSPSNTQDGLHVAVGSPELRSARPSGGLLSDGDPAPPAARDFNAAVNQESDQGPLTGAASRAEAEVLPTALSGRDKEPDALVVIHGPGGFPLMGAVAIGHRRRNPAADVGDFATHQPLGDSNPELAPEPAGQGLLANADIPATDGGNPAQSQDRPARRSWAFPVSVFSGLGVATVFTLNAVLSQPMAGFDYLSSRLDAKGRPQPGKGRRRKPAAAPGRS